MEEIWKDIKGYEGLYQVSNLGRIKSLNYLKTNKEKILKPRNTGRYYTIALYKNKKRKDYLIHRLVAEAFIENEKNKPYINHKDENTYNNIVTNLMWCSHKENMNWGTRNQRISKGNKGKIISEETKRKISNSNKGKKLSEETKRKISLNNGKGRSKKINQYDLNDNYIATWNSAIEYLKANGLKLNNNGINKCCKGKRNKAHGYKWKYAEDCNKEINMI